MSIQLENIFRKVFTQKSSHESVMDETNLETEYVTRTTFAKKALNDLKCLKTPQLELDYEAAPTCSTLILLIKYTYSYSHATLSIQLC